MQMMFFEFEKLDKQQYVWEAPLKYESIFIFVNIDHFTKN